MGGGFSTEDHIFKVLAMGAPYFKAVCMGRAMMIPGFVGNNIEGVTLLRDGCSERRGGAHSGQLRPEAGAGR
jgi:glutamate synthase domain-containing protein 2